MHASTSGLVADDVSDSLPVCKLRPIMDSRGQPATDDEAFSGYADQGWPAKVREDDYLRCHKRDVLAMRESHFIRAAHSAWFGMHDAQRKGAQQSIWLGIESST